MTYIGKLVLLCLAVSLTTLLHSSGMPLNVAVSVSLLVSPVLDYLIKSKWPWPSSPMRNDGSRNSGTKRNAIRLLRSGLRCILVSQTLWKLAGAKPVDTDIYATVGGEFVIFPQSTLQLSTSHKKPNGKVILLKYQLRLRER